MAINKLRMNFKRTGLFILFLLLMFKTSTAIGCCVGDPVTLTELLVSTTDQRAILVVTIDSSWTDQNYGFWSIATVNKVYKHAPEKTQITIVSGSGNSSAGGHLTRKGEQYLLVSGTRDGTIYGGFVCDKFSRQLKPNYRGYRTGIDHMIFIKDYFEKVNNKFTGPVRLEYEDKVYMEGFLKDGIPHGDFKHYETIPYGKYRDQHLLSSQATYVHGKLNQGLPEGIWKYYHKNGEFHFQNFYKDGLLNGVIKKINREHGSEFNFVDGKKHGTGKYFRNGKLSSTENYKDGQKDGLFKSYDKTGIVRNIASYQNGQLHGVQLNLSAEGDTTSLKNYTNGYLDGVYRTVSKRRTEEGTYDMGFKVGIWKTYNARKEFYSIYDYGYEKGINMHQQHMIHDQIIYQDSEGNILSPEDVRGR